MKNYPNIWTLNDLWRFMDMGTLAQIETAPGRVHWFPARPIGYPSFRHRCRAAWLVFTGKADAVRWPHQP